MMEVRCCCDGHLVGHMEGRFVEGKTYTFLVTLARGNVLQDGAMTISTERLTMTAMFWGETSEDGRRQVGQVALQSRDYPIEKLRNIRGFHEARPDGADTSA